MKTENPFQIDSVAGKILAPFLVITLPLILIRDAFNVWKMQPRTFDRLEDVTNSFMMFGAENLLMDVAGVVLVLAFAFFVGRRYVPPIEWRFSSKTLLMAVVVVVIAAAIISLQSYFADGLQPMEGWFGPMIPGAAHLPVLALLCFGVIEGFRPRVTERQLFLIGLASYMIVILFQRVAVSPLLPFSDLPSGDRLDIPFVSIESTWRDWTYLVPSASVILGLLIYIRLGLAALLTFLVSSSLLWIGLTYAGIKPGMFTLGYWISFGVVLVICERFLRRAKT